MIGESPVTPDSQAEHGDVVDMRLTRQGKNGPKVVAAAHHRGAVRLLTVPEGRLGSTLYTPYLAPAEIPAHYDDPLNRLLEHAPVSLQSCSVNSTGDVLCVGKVDGGIDVWDLKELAFKTSIPTAPTSYKALAISDLSPRERDYLDRRYQWSAKPTPGRVVMKQVFVADELSRAYSNVLGVSTDGEAVFAECTSRGARGGLKAFSVICGKELWTVDGDHGCVAPDAGVAAVVDQRQGRVRLVDARNGRITREIELPEAKTLRRAARPEIASAGDFIAVLLGDHVRFYSTKTGACIAKTRAHIGPEHELVDLAVSRDGRYAVVYSYTKGHIVYATDQLR